ncbi:hypothetical protein BpHYR1_018773 [Brachionus plicatilis]|uniref:Uncharacterized protein n=1 Tax=Brachionus plicatilis TaxID=10195 RepID=A0A3M7QXX3_BRAPC|nr:hypothetical protein BpHYR1_018773 [Brachionus plicatilis]
MCVFQVVCSSGIEWVLIRLYYVLVILECVVTQYSPWNGFYQKRLLFSEIKLYFLQSQLFSHLYFDRLLKRSLLFTVFTALH